MEQQLTPPPPSYRVYLIHDVVSATQTNKMLEEEDGWQVMAVFGTNAPFLVVMINMNGALETEEEEIIHDDTGGN